MENMSQANHVGKVSDVFSRLKNSYLIFLYVQYGVLSSALLVLSEIIKEFMSNIFSYKGSKICLCRTSNNVFDHEV